MHIVIWCGANDSVTSVLSNDKSSLTNCKQKTCFHQLLWRQMSSVQPMMRLVLIKRGEEVAVEEETSSLGHLQEEKWREDFRNFFQLGEVVIIG